MSDPIQVITLTQGTPGIPGSQIFVGTTVPSDTLGGQNDFYVRSTTGDLYQKNNGTWGSSTGNIKGPQGIQGIQGPVGSQIYTGGGAPSSGQGVSGDFYVNTANGDIYSKTISGWGSPAGNITGPQGIQGIQGPVGSQILMGSGAPSGLSGVNGDMYIDNSNGNYYKKVSGSWVINGNINANTVRIAGNWDANVDSPPLASGVGTEGEGYLVSAAGTTTIDGINDWQVGDFALFSQGAWRKINNSQVRNVITSGVTTLGPSQDAVYQALLLKQDLTDKGNANGYAALDSGGKVPIAQLPSSVVGDVQYQGAWDASTNSPALASGTGTQGGYYVVSVAGTTTLDGISSWAVGDWVIFNGSVWQKVDNNNLVQSVNGQQGVVSLTTSDVSEGSNEYFTDARAKSASVSNSITPGVTDVAPSQDAVASALSAIVQGGAMLDPVVVATMGGIWGDVPLSGASPLVIDGVTVADGERVLLGQQAVGTDNGVYVCSDDGSTYSLSRSTDANTSSKLKPGVAVTSQKGTAAHFTFIHSTSTFPFVLGTTSQTWTTVEDVSASYGGNFFTNQGYVDSVSKWAVTGGRASPTAVSAGTSLPVVESYREYQFIAGNGGPIDLSAVSPQIQAGIQPGQELLLQGCDDINTVTLANGNGLELNGSYIMKNGSRLLLVWDGTLWGEVTRNDI